MGIYSNSTALNARNSLNIASSGMAKSISRLSSGLRINSAADDPSGLAISERLRTQINGLDRASLNAQDGISYVQTAEGALNETHSILQRMRELAVQGANGTLTSTDRKTIQEEINQLVDEVDRISTSTEFNTKKLLNGDASALWSSSSDAVNAVITGKVREGNYELEINVTPTEAHVLKSDIFSVKDGLQAAVITKNTESSTGINDVTIPTNLLTNQTSVNSGNYVISAQAATAASGAVAEEQLAVYYKTTASSITMFKTAGTVQTAAAANYHSGGTYLQIEVTKGATMVDTAEENLVKIRYSFNGKTWSEGTIKGDTAGTISFSGEDANGDTWKYKISGDFSGKSMYEGEKILIGLNFHDSAKKSDHIQIAAPVYSNNKKTASADLIQLSRDYSFDAGTLSGASKDLDIIQLDARTGDWVNGSLTVNFSEEFDFATSSTFAFEIKEGGVANGSTKLSRVDRFYDDDGNFVIGSEGKEFTIYSGSGKSATIFIDGEDTLDEFADKINNAIRDSLGLGTGDLESGKHYADFVQDATAGTDEAVKGTIVIRSPLMGEDGKLSFSGDEDLINALSLVTINEPTPTQMDVVVRDAHTSELIGRDTVSSGSLVNVIDGVRVDLSSSLDTKVSWDDTTKSLKFESESGVVKEYLHVVDNGNKLHIGANQNQTLDNYIGDMGSTALRINSLLVTSQESAENAIGTIDNAIDMVSSERSRIGAVVNRLEHTINNLNVQQENAVAAESRIRDLDMAKEATELAKWQVLSQAATSMLAQANSMNQNYLSLIR